MRLHSGRLGSIRPNKLIGYYIIGGDKKTYGPKPGREISDWIREGRLNADSRISTEDNLDWRPLSEFPEFAKELKLSDKEIESEEYDEGDDELSFPIPRWLWVIKIVFVWPIYWPCWLIWKIVYVAIPTGLVLCVAGAVLDNESLTNVGNNGGLWRGIAWANAPVLRMGY